MAPEVILFTVPAVSKVIKSDGTVERVRRIIELL